MEPAAIPWYEKALQLDPPLVDANEAHRFLASALSHVGRYDDSLFHYRGSIRIDPQNPLTRQEIAETAKKKNR